MIAAAQQRHQHSNQLVWPLNHIHLTVKVIKEMRKDIILVEKNFFVFGHLVNKRSEQLQVMVIISVLFPQREPNHST